MAEDDTFDRSEGFRPSARFWKSQGACSVARCCVFWKRVIDMSSDEPTTFWCDKVAETRVRSDFPDIRRFFAEKILAGVF